MRSRQVNYLLILYVFMDLGFKVTPIESIKEMKEFKKFHYLGLDPLEGGERNER